MCTQAAGGESRVPRWAGCCLVYFCTPIGWLSLPLICAPTWLYRRVVMPDANRYWWLPAWGWRHYEAGDWARLRADGEDLLALAARLPRDSNYGQAIHDGNQFLGLVALHEGNVPAARERLAAAGQTPGGPGLDSYGPRMVLARELLKAGETDAVLAYLDAIEGFMVGRRPAPGWAPWVARAHAQVEQRHRHDLAAWRDQIARGELPDGKEWNA